MPLTPIAGNASEPNWCAAAEQMALNRVIYRDDVDAVLEVVRAVGPAEEMARNNNPADWTLVPDSRPRYVVFGHNGEYWWVIQGTYTTHQWVLNATGALATSALGNRPLGFHAQWASMATALYNDWKAVEPDEPLKPMNISGHSMGGAVAWMLGILFVQLEPQRPVRVLTFGSPRPFAGGLSRPDVPVHYDVQTSGDIVTHLPPNVPFIDPFQWRLQGAISVVDLDGTLLAPTQNAGEVPLFSLPDGAFRRHFPSSYTTALAARVNSLRDCPPATNAVLLAAGLVPGVPVPGGAGATPFRRRNVALWKVNFIFNFGRDGWSETVYYNGANDLAGAQVAAQALAYDRAGMLARGNIPVLEYIRISEIKDSGARGDSKPFPTQSRVRNRDCGFAGDADRRNGIYATINSGTPFKQRTWKFKGMPRQWIKGNLNVLADEFDDATLVERFNRFRNALLQIPVNPAAPPKVSSWGLLYQSQDNETPITLVTVDGDGQIIITTAADPAYEVNEEIIIGGMRGPGTKRLNGRTRVVEVLTGNQYRLAKRKCDPCVLRPTNKGDARPHDVLFVGFTQASLTGYSTWKVGRPFRPGVGKQAACCR